MPFHSLSSILLTLSKNSNGEYLIRFRPFGQRIPIVKSTIRHGGKAVVYSLDYLYNKAIDSLSCEISGAVGGILAYGRTDKRSDGEELEIRQSWKRERKMRLKKLTNRIFYLEYVLEVDRPMLAYIKGDKLSLAIDAGYSSSHVRDFYGAIESKHFKKPDFTVITHWHYDHTFGMHAISGISIAHDKTNEFLKDQQERARDTSYIEVLKKEDVHFRKEYDGQTRLNIVLSDIAFSDKMTLDLGGITARIFHTVSPHSEDTVCIYVPEEKVLFLGDSTSEDFFNDGYMDKDKLHSLIQTIQSIDCDYCILSHCEPLSKDDLLAYLYSLEV